MTLRHDGLRVMNSQIWKQYKNCHHTIPRCVSCNMPILVGEKFETFLGRKVKYCCEECSRREVVVYQYPTSKPRRVAEKYMLPLAG